MSDEIKRSFVLVQSGDSAVILGADSVKLVRLLTNHPDDIPQELVMEDGRRVPLTMVENDTIALLQDPSAYTSAPVAQPVAQTVSPALGTIRELMATKSAPWPSDMPPEPFGLEEYGELEHSLKRLSASLDDLSARAATAADEGLKRWKLLAQQMTVLKNNYAKMLSQREKIQAAIKES